MPFRTTYFFDARPADGAVPVPNADNEAFLATLGTHSELVLNGEAAPSITLDPSGHAFKVVREFDTLEHANAWLDFLKTKDVFISGSVSEV